MFFNISIHNLQIVFQMLILLPSFANINSYITHHQMLTLLLYFVAFYSFYVYYSFLSWEKHFGRKRVSRSIFGSPSHGQIPDVKSFNENKKNILTAAAKYPGNFSKCELLYPLMKNKNTRKEEHSNTITRRGSRSNFLVANEEGIKEHLSNEKSKNLDMDHVYLTFSQYLWAVTCIGPNSLVLWVKGVALLWLRKKLHKIGYIQPEPFDPSEIVGRLLLEGTLAIHYYARTDDDSDLGDIAGFFFHDFPYIDSHGYYQKASLFAVDIDLHTKKMVKAKFDNTNVSASEALTLLWFNTISGNHVKLHSLANWGTNTEPETKEKHPFLYQNSIVTTIYNYFGFSCFHTYIPFWSSMGLLSHDWKPKALNEVFSHGIQDNIWAHPNIQELIPHSRLVKFICTLRPIFLSLFQKYHDEFPGIDGEALFVGTVLHSLDHTCMEWNLDDALWLDVDCPKFGKMAELGRIVRVGFVEDVPGLSFHKRFKGSKHPFYKSVYEKAAKIDKKYADEMDTCIIK